MPDSNASFSEDRMTNETQAARAGDGKQQAVAWVDERAIAWLANHPKGGGITTKLAAVRSAARPMALYAAAPAAPVLCGELTAEEAEQIANSRPGPITAAPAAAPAWQPIETAPKDGSPIWVIDMNALDPQAGPAFWRNSDWHAGNEYDWQDKEAPEKWGYWPSPTHWHPLPAPPVQAPATGDAA